MPTFSSNQEIDSKVIEILRRNPQGLPHMSLGSSLESTLVLKAAGRQNLSPFHNACEHANRACQRLRKKGLIRFDTKTGWVLNAERSSGVIMGMKQETSTRYIGTVPFDNYLVIRGRSEKDHRDIFARLKALGFNPDPGYDNGKPQPESWRQFPVILAIRNTLTYHRRGLNYCDESFMTSTADFLERYPAP